MRFQLPVIDPLRFMCQGQNELGGKITSRQPDKIWEWSNQKGEGCMHSFVFPSGIQLHRVQMIWKQPARFSYRLNKPVLDVNVCLKGKVDGEITGIGSRRPLIQEGKSLVYRVSSLQKECWFPEKQEIHFMCLTLDPLSFYAFTHHMPLSPPSNVYSRDYWFHEDEITPPIQMILHQIKNGPTDNWSNYLYLESKCLEMLALRLERIWGTGQQTDGNPISPDDLKRVEQARNLLVNRLEDPPAIADLARQVTLNEMKLRNGFKKRYQTTILRYLRDVRLEKARRLLIETDKNVTEIAGEVGYSNTSYFISLFKKKFGMTPRVYRSQT